MITRIRPAHWTASRLVLLALAATFAAMMVSALVRGRLTRSGEPTRTQVVKEAPRAAAHPLNDYLALARRNLFAAPPANEAASSPGATSQPGSLRLLGTGRHGGQLFAIIEDTAAKRQDVVTIGDALGGGKVVEIGWRRIVIKRGAEQDVLRVAEQGPTGGGSAPAAAPAAATSTSSATDEIRKIGDDRYLVSQAEVDHSMENLSDLFTQLRAVPNLENGKTNGFKLFAIKQGSLFQKIGLENNDIVQRVNGVDLNDPTRAMALFQELQGQTRLSVDVVRGSEARTLTYEIR